MLSEQYVVFFGLFLTFAAYAVGKILFEKTKHFPLCNPTIVAIAIIIIILKVFNIEYATYIVGGDVFNTLLFPATIVLALPIFRNLHLIKKNFVPIMGGCAIGALVGIGSVFILCKLFGLDDIITNSILGKSITTPIGLEVTRILGGEASIIIIGISITGLFGTVNIPFLTKLLKLKNPIVIGIAAGTSSHVMGTSKALEMGDDIGAMSSASVGIVGIFTLIYAIILPW